MNKLAAILLQSVTWAFSGALYGAFFIGVLNYLLLAAPPDWLPYVIASVIAGTVISAFFGSMLVALGGTLAGILTAISYQILFSTYHQLMVLVGVAFVVGLISGSFFTKKEIRLSQPMAQGAAGAIGGLASGPLTYLILMTLGDFDNHWLTAAISVSFVGLAYVALIRHTPALCNNRLSQVLGGPLVSGIIAMSVAATFWLIGESYMTIPELDQVSPYQGILDAVPWGLLGGALGGAFGGAMLEILGIRMEEHIT